MEDNRVVTINSRNEILNTENFNNPDAAYEYYMDCIRVLKKNLNKGEEITVIRTRWNQIMTMETVKGE